MKKIIAAGTPAGLIETPKKEGYVFSHWSKVKPDTLIEVKDVQGRTSLKKADCPPFDFANEVINEDITLYAVFIPKVHANFYNEDVKVQTQTTIRGGRVYNPVEHSPGNEEWVIDDRFCKHLPNGEVVG